MSQSIVCCLIHGHGVDASIWDGIYADLASDASVLKPDFSHMVTHTSVEGYAEELYARLQTAQIGKVVLVGHSMGGYIALAFAERYPDMVQGLVLYHSTATADDNARKEVRRQAIEGLETQGTIPFIQKQLPKMVAPDFPSEKTQALVERFVSLPADALIAGMKAIAGRPDRTHVLRDADFPVLIVLGREDQLIPYEKTAQLADLSDAVRVVTIEHAGHLSMIEQPAQSVEVLKEFLGQY
ncbi:alpha/beta fold hydrolase [Spirosoma foliorum]|uniref:Alpha/beta hydrolase n=1 Tax=Spirosoma foliorum TaxID=2710596 RepID=A0A7G5GMS2_9BACT|nr:alpha/beta hydrolase [Spirosoma foliorum]QMW00164.1 alpha/beta hydrolase [Spirosoma foliorum]